MIQRIKNNAFARNSLILFAGSMVANVIGYFFHFIIGRMVSVPVYGEVESLISLIAIISVPASALLMVIAKFCAEAKAENDLSGSHEIISYFNKKVFKYGFPFFVFALLISPLVKDYLKIHSIWTLIIVWIMMLLSFFAALVGGALNGWQKFKEVSIAGIIGALVKLLTAIIFVKIGFAAGGVVGGFASGSIATYLLSLYYLRFILKQRNRAKDYISKIDFVSVKKYIIPVLIGNLALNMLSNVDMILAKHNLNPVMAGQYGALTVVSKIIFFGTGIIATVLFSMSAEEYHKKNDSTKTFKQALFMMSALGLAAIFIYALFPKLILFMLFGNRYQDVSGHMVWFAISVTLYSFVNLIFQYLLSMHKTKISYLLLFISILAILVIELFGNSISVIIAVMAISQVLGILAGAYLLLNSKKGVKNMPGSDLPDF